MSYERQNVNYLIGDAVSPVNWSKLRVEEYARRVAKLGEFDIGGDPRTLAEKFGGRVAYQPIDEWINESGSIYVHGRHNFDIVLPLYTSPWRDRFTVAHELGHFFLHARQGDIPLIATRAGSKRLEWEANWFAASLLMPREEFVVDSANLSLPVLAERYGVSTDAARVRRESLGL